MRSLPKLVGVAVVLFGLGWMAGTFGQNPPRRDQSWKEQARGHANTMAQVAQRALQQLDKQVESGLISPNDRLVLTWSEREIAALQLVGDQQRLVTAVEQYRRRLHGFIERFQAMQKRGGVTPANLLSLEYNLAQAEYWLSESRAGHPGNPPLREEE